MRTSPTPCLLALLLIASPSSSRAGGPPEAGEARPNVVLIMADDMGYSDIGPFGGEVETPSLDRLSREGMRLSQFYNNAKCTTTRASLLTGLYPRQDGPLLRENMITLGEAMRLAGYRTALSGKWHLGSEAPRRPIDRGFDESFGLWDGCCNFFDPSRPDPDFKGGRVRFWGHNGDRVAEFPDDFYSTDAISEHAADAARRFASEGGPFFLHVCYTAPHYPLQARPEDIAKYRGKYMMGWEELRERRHRRQLELGLIDPSWELPPPGPEVAPWDEAPHKEWQDLRMAVYAAMIDRMDRGIGLIVEALEETGTLENTLILFLSDNGGCAETPGGEDPAQIPGPEEYYAHCGPGWAFAQNTPFRRYKQWVHEGGISTPLIARWPGVVEPGTIDRQVGHIIDLMPTLCEVAGIDYPSSFDGNELIPVEGLSLLPVLRGEPREPHDALFWEWAGNRAVRAGDWKLAWDRKVKRWELYDLAADRTETNDLAAEHPDRVAAMADAWQDWARRTGVRGGPEGDR